MIKFIFKSLVAAILAICFMFTALVNVIFGVKVIKGIGKTEEEEA